MASKYKPRTRTKDKGQGPAKAEITVILTDQQTARALKGAKVVTAQELARQTGVKVSAANRYLRDAVSKGTMKRAGGYSGHWLYQPVSS